MEASEAKIDELTIPEISETKHATFTARHPDTIYLLGCGDDRSLTPESIEALKQDGIENPEVFVRYYGGALGAARIAGVAIAKQHGREVLDSFYGDFEAFVLDIAERIKDTSNLVPALHSAVANEGNPAHLCTEDSDTGLGCAYAKLLGGVTALNMDDSVVSTASNEARVMTQQEFDEAFTDIVRANGEFAEHFAIDPSAGFDRQGFRRLGLPSMILAGDHAAVRSNSVTAVINFMPDAVSSPNKANNTDEPFYNNDVTIMAEALIRALPEYNLDPRTLLNIMMEDIAATRQALAGGEDLTAKELPLERYGDIDEAVAYLEQLHI